MNREPLRIPDNWRSQDRQFVIQLERVLDKLYQGKVDVKDFKEAVEGMKPATILPKTSLTSSYVDVSTDEKLSDYEVIVVEAYRDDWCMGSVTLASYEFVSATGVAFTSFWNGTSIEYDAKYKTDTSVSVKKITSDTGTQYIKIIGFK